MYRYRYQSVLLWRQLISGRGRSLGAEKSLESHSVGKTMSGQAEKGLTDGPYRSHF